MKNFLLDLWYDLRAKRLWPVAALLLAALVATPVVLSKKAEESEPAPATAAAAAAEAKKPEGPAALANVKLEELAKGSGSSLSSFDPRNPFAPPRKALEAAHGNAEGSTVTSTATSAGTGSDSGSGSSTGGGSVTTDVPSGSGGGTVPDVGGYTPPSGRTGGGDDVKAPEYTYVVDVTFRANDQARTVRGLRKLDMLPDAESPLLIFMGVTEKAGNAVFMVDSTLQAAGEGTCKPRPANCASLHLGPGSEHEFATDEGESYVLRVDEIRRVKLGAKAGASTKNKKTASAAIQKHAARGSAPRVLADLVKVSTHHAADSISEKERR
jgi:hypothetical protein